MVILGRVNGPYGVKGWVHVHPFGDDPLDWRRMKAWHLAVSQDGPWQAYSLAGCKAHGDGLVAGFAGVPDRDAAENLQGCWIAAPRDELPPTKENEYYWADLIGMRVENMADERLGTVSGLIETGANDVLRVVDDSGVERLLPFVDAVVHAVDRAARRIRVDWQLDWN